MMLNSISIFSRKNIFLLFLLFFFTPSHSQTIGDTITEAEVKGIINYLASDKLRGRVNFTHEQLEAASFIGNWYNLYGLQPFPGYESYYIPFSPYGKYGDTEKFTLRWNQKAVSKNHFAFLSAKYFPESKRLTDFRIVEQKLPLADSLLFRYWKDRTDVLIWVKTGLSKNQAVPGNLIIPEGHPQSDILLAAAPDVPKKLKFSMSNGFVKSFLFNVVGILPGKSKPEEIIVFSAHYDHIDDSHLEEGRRIFNGANDNASGTTALLQLAKYYSLRNNNERTIMFCAFAGEELGLLGSYDFAKIIDPKKIIVNINIEMIGIPGQGGQNTFFITGSDRSDFSRVFEENIKGSGIKLVAEPFNTFDLYKRSDNYPLALKKIVAHTIMSGDDEDGCYHRSCDDAERIDIGNMTRLIHAIARGCQPVIKGHKDLPSQILK